MKKRFRNLISILCAIGLTIILGNDYGPALKTIPEKIIDTVVSIQSSSGIIVYSNNKHALVLTAHHVIEDVVNLDGTLIDDNNPVIVKFMYFFKPDDNIRLLQVYYEVEKIYIEENEDIALLEIKVGTKLNYARLSQKEPRVGKEVFLAGNPNFNYRTLTKGIISSKDRYSRQMHVWQISGGTIYGLSGGGVFNMKGELVAIAKSVDRYNSGFCLGSAENIECVRNAIPHIGYFVPLRAIKVFLLSTEFRDRFNY